MPITYVPEEHHMLRYVPYARLRRDEDGNVLGVVGQAFHLRDGEEYLSATWVEFCNGENHDDCVHKAIRLIRASKLEVKAKSGFAKGNVARVKSVCAADAKKYKLRVVHEPENDNAAHAAVRGWPAENLDLLDLIAEDVWSEVVLNKDVSV